MSANDGVGKKIVEALKKQSNPEVELTPEVEEVQTNDEIETVEDVEITENNDTEAYEVKEEYPTANEDIEIVEQKEETFEIKEQIPVAQSSVSFNQPKFVAEDVAQQEFQGGWNFEEKQEFKPMFQEAVSYEVPTVKTKQFDMPPNVSVLKKLISQLPTGVTKQTGAQIIKQTMEALGISMNTVLHEAQKVQDDMNDSIKNCMMTIQEYKNNIKNLEKQGLDYQRQVNQLNDLISLFILSDKD